MKKKIDVECILFMGKIEFQVISFLINNSTKLSRSTHSSKKDEDELSSVEPTNAADYSRTELTRISVPVAQIV